MIHEALMIHKSTKAFRIHEGLPWPARVKHMVYPA